MSFFGRIQNTRTRRRSSDLAAMSTRTEMPMRAAEKEGYVVVNAEKDHEDPESLEPCTEAPSMDVEKTINWKEQLLKDPKNRLALSALTANPVNALLRNPTYFIRDVELFNTRIPHEGSPVTNQRSSGRCWLFATTNVLRIPIMQKYDLASFELSQSYLFFWDKIEKANWFLENVLDTVDEELDGRLMQALLASPVGDGGQWDMAANLVAKWGLVPQSLYPDSFNAMNSPYMDRIVTAKLREYALQLRAMAKDSNHVRTKAISSAKYKMLHEVHDICALMLGPPPSPTEKFTWQFYSKDGTYHTVSKTPLEFGAELNDSSAIRACGGTDVHKLFSLVNDPRNDYLTHLSVNRLGNVYGGRPITYINVDMDTIKSACIAMIKKGFPVFFGSDVGKYVDSQKGIMDTKLFDYSLAFNTTLNMNKEERLRVGESAMNHAMVLTAVHVEDGKPVRWRVENSWSESAGDRGYFVMTDEWMDEYVYQAVVDPSAVSEEVRKVLKTEPKMLPLWDPMGALA